MPQPRKSSPRHKGRRSRSYSPKQSHRRRSRSPSPRGRRSSRSPRKRSRSPQRKHYTQVKNASRSPHRRSRSPKRRSPSPPERHYPVKRPADSSGKRLSHRSRSRSHTPVKKIREDRHFKESSPDGRRYSSSKKQRSPSPRKHSRSPYSGKMHSDRPGTSKQPLFPVEKKRNEIDFVKIVDLEPKEKLNKRFQTLEQIAQGGFDFEENITIGIHRGPQHIDLDDDVPVDYDFNPKTFLMVFPKKDYSKAVFDRDEILAFHHDDILDEEAYVEKRTITVKPSEKQRPKWMDDYKITVGQDREGGYGDKRMVQDSRSRRRRSRSADYEPEVKVRLDPKPDPRYEKMYRDQQRHEEESMMKEKIQRNPNDLRYSLMKRSSDMDRGPGRDRGSDRHRDRERDIEGDRFDARSKIVQRRQESWSGDRLDRHGPGDRRDSRDSPPPRTFGEKRKAVVKTDLPDFKNRPERFLDRVPSRSNPNDDFEIDPSAKRPRQRWGHCKLCDLSLHSEAEALEHVRTAEHLDNEDRSQKLENRFNRGTPENTHGWPKDERRYTNAPSFNSRNQIDDPESFTNKFKFETWKENPEEIPKGAGYYEHDNRNRDDMNFWERKQMFMQTGRYPTRGRVRGFGFRGSTRGFRGAGRGNFRGRGGIFRGNNQNPYTIDRRKIGSSSDEWKHDKFSELEGLEESGDSPKEREDKGDRKKEKEHRGRKERKDNKESREERKSRDEKDAEEIRKQEENMKIDVRVELTEPLVKDETHD